MPSKPHGRIYAANTGQTTWRMKQSSDKHAADECIRPADVYRLPEALPGDGAALYGLVWQRFISSQMFPAQYRVTVARILVGQNREKPFPLELRAQGWQLYFDGWLRFNPDTEERCVEVHLPTLTEGTRLDAVEVRIDEHTAAVPPTIQRSWH